MSEKGWNHNTHFHGLLLAGLQSSAERALDVGCGDGQFARRLADRCRDVVAIDVDERHVAAARIRRHRVLAPAWVITLGPGLPPAPPGRSAGYRQGCALVFMDPPATTPWVFVPPSAGASRAPLQIAAELSSRAHPCPS